MKPTIISTRVAILLAVAAAIAVPSEAAALGFEASKRAGIHEITHTWGSAPHDFNRDGLEDILIGRHHQGPARLYENQGDGRFARVSKARFPTPKRDRHDCDWGDVNNDGLDDVYCSVGGGRGYKRKPNELWVQQGDGSFVDRAGVFRVRDLDGRGRDVAFLDVNNDGLVDLFVGNDFPRYDGFKSKNRLFINVGGTHFRGARSFGLDKGRVGGQTVEAVDYDRDGWTDLLVCGDRRLFLYRNLRGTRFRDVSRGARVNMRCETAALADMNGDRKPDLVVVKEKRLIVKRQRRGRFGQLTYRRSLKRGGDLAVGFVDRDRRPDLYVLQFGEVGSKDRLDLMLLNRRGGRSFKNVPIPQTRRGKGESVQPIDHDQNGRTDFVVLNGSHKAKGPVRLVAFGR